MVSSWRCLGFRNLLVSKCMSHVQMACFSFCDLRLGPGKEDRKNADKYIAKAKRALSLEAAAEAWSAGVPWNEALDLATRAVNKVDEIIGPMAKKKPKAKAKSRVQ